MTDLSLFYIDGAFVPASSTETRSIINPADGTLLGRVAMGTAEDVDRAVRAARRAFATFSTWSREDRIALLRRILTEYEKRAEDIARAITQEVGIPITFARERQVAAGAGHVRRTIEVLTNYSFDERLGDTVVTREPIGVCGFITPWNWPMNQIVAKVAPALAAGCTMVLKPSELAPSSAMILAEVLHAAGVPAGVFNLVNGDGKTGQALASHPDVDMISFTGSTRAGVLVAKAAADTVKRVHQELGGKSPNLILDDADLEVAIAHATRTCFDNNGQSCNAPTRLIVPRTKLAEVLAIAKRTAESLRQGDPDESATDIGPVVSEAQFDRIRHFISNGLEQGAKLLTGGAALPDGIDRGFFIRPTIFADVTPDMTIAREEIFGPVLVVIAYDSEEEGIAIANDSAYGLSAYVSSGDRSRAEAVARRLRAGMVHINSAKVDNAAPFGGYRQSGNGREWGLYGFEEFLEVKSMFGHRGTLPDQGVAQSVSQR